MIIDLSCPLELRGYELLKDDKGTTRAYISLFNLSHETVVAYSATMNWYNALTRESVTEMITVDEMRVAPRSAFKLVHSTQNFSDADHVEMYFSSVVFLDGETWTPHDGDIIDIGEQPVLSGEALDRLKSVAGEDCVQYPQVQMNYWRCVCGRINLLDSEACVRCERDRGDVLTRLNKKELRKAAHAKRKRAVYDDDDAYARADDNRALKFVLIALLIILVALVGYSIGKRGNFTISKSAPTPTTKAIDVMPDHLSNNFYK